MKFSIHNRKTRILVSVIVFLVVLFLIIPHLMDVNPPLYVEVLLFPVKALGYVLQLIRHLKGGVEKQGFREGTPIDLLFGLIIVFFLVILYPIVTYIMLLLTSKILRIKNKSGNNLDFEINGFSIREQPNKSMDVRAKQRLCYERLLVTFSGLSGGFAPRHLNRSTFLGFSKQFDI